MLDFVPQVASLEKMLSSLCPPSQVSASLSYAKAASLQPAKVLPPPSPPLELGLRILLNSLVHEIVILFFLGFLFHLELKSDIDELLQYLTRKSVNINDVFRLGKYSASSSKRPWPILIKLATAWDHKIILLQKCILRDNETHRLFLREDVPPDHRFRQKAEHPSPKDKVSVSEKPPLPHTYTDNGKNLTS